MANTDQVIIMTLTCSPSCNVTLLKCCDFIFFVMGVLDKNLIFIDDIGLNLKGFWAVCDEHHDIKYTGILRHPKKMKRRDLTTISI